MVKGAVTDVDVVVKVTSQRTLGAGSLSEVGPSTSCVVVSYATEAQSILSYISRVVFSANVCSLHI